MSMAELAIALNRQRRLTEGARDIARRFDNAYIADSERAGRKLLQAGEMAERATRGLARRFGSESNADEALRVAFRCYVGSAAAYDGKDNVSALTVLFRACEIGARIDIKPGDELWGHRDTAVRIGIKHEIDFKLWEGMARALGSG